MRFLIATLIAFIAIPVSSQKFTLFATSNAPMVGSNIEIDIRALNFDSITGISFATTWDTSIFKFVDITGFELPNTLLGNNFGTTEVNKGILRFNWEDLTTVGYSAKDSVKLFRLRLKVLKTDKNTIINFKSIPPGIYLEITKNGIKIEDKDLIIRPLYPFLTSISDVDILEFCQVYPNPIDASSKLKLILKEPLNAIIDVYNGMGQKINTIQEKLQIGNNEVDIFDKIPTLGIYYLNINKTLTLKIIKAN